MIAEARQEVDSDRNWKAEAEAQSFQLQSLHVKDHPILPLFTSLLKASLWEASFSPWAGFALSGLPEQTHAASQQCVNPGKVRTAPEADV